MPLPLPVRKGIRDNEPKLKENMEKINAATGKEWAFEVDWEGNLSQFDANFSKENIGGLYQDQVMEALARNLEKACQDPLTKESLDEATSSSRITIRVNDKLPSYWNIKFENGDIVVEHKKSICNVSDIQWFDLAKVIPAQAGGLSLKVRQNIEENRERTQQAMDEIGQVTGAGEWIFEVDWNTNIPKVDANQQENLGSIYCDVTQYIHSMLKNHLQKPTTKEAFNEATSSRTLVITVNDKLKSYWDVSIKDGNLLVQHKPNICNVGDIQWTDLPKIIPAPGGMSLVAKLNIEENRERFDENMEKINKVTGEEFIFDDGCIIPIYEKMDPNQRERIGEIIHYDLLSNLAANLEQRLADEMVKEAFLEVVSNKTIVVEGDPKQKTYWDLKFKDGNVVLSFKSGKDVTICNVSDIRWFDFEPQL